MTNDVKTNQTMDRTQDGCH